MRAVGAQLTDIKPRCCDNAVPLGAVTMCHSAEVSRCVMPGARLIWEEKNTVA